MMKIVRDKITTQNMGAKITAINFTKEFFSEMTMKDFKTKNY